MKIVILGAGAVGSTLADLLSEENDLTIVDNDPVKLHKLEEEAMKEGIDLLYTEASQISFRLFLKHNWEIKNKEKVIINNNYFERYKMIKIFN